MKSTFMLFSVLALLSVLLVGCGSTDSVPVTQTLPPQEPVFMAPETCTTFDCLAQKFVACEPATLQLESDTSIYFYQIMGPNSGYCEVRSKFLADIDPTLPGKGMSCLYDNRLPMLDALADRSRCTGELATLLAETA